MKKVESRIYLSKVVIDALEEKTWNIFKVNNWHDMILMFLLLTLNIFRTFF